jgi:hypothetical protein
MKDFSCWLPYHGKKIVSPGHPDLPTEFSDLDIFGSPIFVRSVVATIRLHHLFTHNKTVAEDNAFLRLRATCVSHLRRELQCNSLSNNDCIIAMGNLMVTYVRSIA